MFNLIVRGREDELFPDELFCDFMYATRNEHKGMFWPRDGENNIDQHVWFELKLAEDGTMICSFSCTLSEEIYNRILGCSIKPEQIEKFVREAWIKFHVTK